MKKVMCIGHAAYDITLPVDHYPIENTKMRIKPGVECGGGAAANAAYLLSKWHMETHFVGVIGNDLYGNRIKEEFRQVKTNMDYLEVSNTFDTTTSYILANASNGSRTIIVSRNKNEEVKCQSITIHPDVVLVDGEEPTISKKVLLENPTCISVLDAGNLKDSIVELCNYVKYLVCSKDFAEEYTKVKIEVKDPQTLLAAYQKLKNDFHNTIVITLGEAGSYTEIESKMTIIPTLKVTNPVDSTAAGDIFHGAFTYFISNDYSLYRSIRLANIAGAISVTKLGGKNSMPSLKEVLELEHSYDI
ncbi:MAG: PfkB family carbohydrate kinase [bacterium]|nr:PfkB family carbohydrate kinase [bacterium]